MSCFKSGKSGRNFGRNFCTNPVNPVPAGFENSKSGAPLQTCKLKGVDAFIEQFNNLLNTTLRECLRILGENVVILVIFC